jgi:hypothetical protein
MHSQDVYGAQLTEVSKELMNTYARRLDYHMCAVPGYSAWRAE